MPYVNGVYVVDYPNESKRKPTQEQVKEVRAVYDHIKVTTKSVPDFYNDLFASVTEASSKVLPSGLVWALMPINHVLWLYELGNNAADSLWLYHSLSTSIKLGYKAGEGRKKDKWVVPLSQTPISRQLREYLNKNASRKWTPRTRQFGQLMGLVTCLCCAMRGHQRDSSDMVREAIGKAMPNFSSSLTSVYSGQESNYNAVYTEASPFCNTVLTAAMPVHYAAMTIMRLLPRTLKAEERRRGRPRCQIFPLHTILRQLYEVMAYSLSPDASKAKLWASYFGEQYLW